MLAGAQAVEFLAPLEPGRGVGAARAFVRTLSERLREDRSLSADIERVAAAVVDGSLVAAVETAAGALGLMPPRRGGNRERPIPEHPYRGSALVYGAMAMLLVVAAAVTGGGLLRAVVAAAGFFVVATSWNWWRFARRMRAREARERETGVARSDGNGDRKGTS